MSSKRQNSQISYRNLVTIKSKFDAEFRRFSIERHKLEKLDDFLKLLEEIHLLKSISIVLMYIDPKDGCILPLTNDDNFKKAVDTSRPNLRLIIQRKGESFETFNGPSTKFSGILSPFNLHTKSKLSISNPQNFRQVAAIIDVDIVPEVYRRVRLLKHGSEKPLGFYIRDGTSVRVTSDGLERVPGIYISRLVPGGLAESTGLLAVNDEVIEVNGIEVAGKTLDQVTDMMVANSSNLIITVKPAKQSALTHSTIGSTRNSCNSFSRNSQMSSVHSVRSGASESRNSGNSDEDNLEDEIRDLTNQPNVTLPTIQDEGILHL